MTEDRDATTVGIYESSGYLCKSHWYKLQRIFTQFVTKFCSGRHLVMLQEFTKVVDVYKKTQRTLKSIVQL